MDDERTLKDFMAGAAGEDAVAHAGAPLPEGARPAASDEPVVAALRTVFDPEIPVNIFDLGLIYGLERGADGSVKIAMTLTAPGCPVAGSMPGQVADAVATAEGVGEVEVRLVWDPPWSPERMSDEAKVALDMF